MARAKDISPLQLPLFPRSQIATPTAANHQYVRKPFRIPDHQFVRAKYFSPGRRLLVARNRLNISAAHHLLHGRKYFAPTFAIVTQSPDRHHSICQYSLCSRNSLHLQSPFVGAKYFSPGRRPLVAHNRLSVSAAHHLLHGRNIFRPYVRHRRRITTYLFLPCIICGTGEIFFAPTLAIVAPHHTQLFNSLPTPRLWAACSARA